MKCCERINLLGTRRLFVLRLSRALKIIQNGADLDKTENRLSCACVKFRIAFSCIKRNHNFLKSDYRKSYNKPPGGLLNFRPPEGMEGGGAYLKFFDRQRQNYTMSMEFEILRSFDNIYELLRYTTNTIKN